MTGPGDCSPARPGEGVPRGAGNAGPALPAPAAASCCCLRQRSSGSWLRLLPPPASLPPTPFRRISCNLASASWPGERGRDEPGSRSDCGGECARCGGAAVAAAASMRETTLRRDTASGMGCRAAASAVCEEGGCTVLLDRARGRQSSPPHLPQRNLVGDSKQDAVGRVEWSPSDALGEKRVLQGSGS